MKKESNKNWTTCLRLNTGDGSPRVFLLNSHFLGSVPNPHPFFLCPFCFLSSTSLFASFLAHTLCLYFSAVYYLRIFSSTHLIFSLLLPSPRQRTWHAHLSHSLIQERINLFIYSSLPEA